MMWHARACRCSRHISKVELIVEVISISIVGVNLQKVGEVEVLIVFVTRRTLLIFVNEAHVTVGGYAYEGIECLRGTNALVSKSEVVARSRPKYASKHDVGVEVVIEDFIAVLAVGGVELSNGVARTVVDSTARTTLVVGHRYPRNQYRAGTVECNSLGRPVSDSNGLVRLVVDEDASSWRNLAANRTRASLKRLRCCSA